MRLYHECDKSAIDSIRAEGIRPATFNETSPPELVDDTYYLKEGDGFSAVYTLISQYNPIGPAHSDSVFFFGTRGHTMLRTHRITLEIPDDYARLYRADWNHAKHLFMNVACELETNGQLSQEAVETAVENYCDSIAPVTSTTDIERGYEYFTPMTPIPPEYITDISLRRPPLVI